MPAITVPDITVLPRIAAPVGARPRTVRQVTIAPQGMEGEGFPVRRAFAGVDLADLDPFIHLDQMGEVEYAPGEPKGTPWHPHRGFETVTYLLDGEFIHADSHGGGGIIKDGDTQWMTAGAGVLHIETPPESLVMSGGLFHGFQLWVNLPKVLKMSPPRYQDINHTQITMATTHDGGTLLRVIAGQLGDVSGPGVTHTPITMVHATIAPGAQMSIPWRNDFNALAYALSGDGKVGATGQPIGTGQLAVFGEGDSLVISADSVQDARHAQGLDVLLLGGLPIREPIAWAGPFVMNTRLEVVAAFEEYSKGAFGQKRYVHGAPEHVQESNIGR